VPRLPERAAIYIATDGTVHFGALFEGLLPVARALGDVRGSVDVCGDVDGKGDGAGNANANINTNTHADGK